MYLNHPWLSKPTGWKPNKPVVGFLKSSYDIGVGCGNNIHATLLQVLLHFHIYVMLRCGKFSCTSIHTYMLRCGKFSCTFICTSCYAATLLQVLLHFPTYVLLRCCKFSCTFIYTSRYAAASSLALPYIPTCYANERNQALVKIKEWRKKEWRKMKDRN